MTKRYPRGSEWRKWDLHVHLPGTKLNDGYKKKKGSPDWDRFADAIEASDVAVVGVTDYFSVESQLAFVEHFKNKFPASGKLLLVNLEVRLNESVNGSQHLVDFHVIFNDGVSPKKMSEYVAKLKTQITDEHGRFQSCAELTDSDMKSATVTRADVKMAFDETFGTKAEPSDKLIYLAPASNNGLRAAKGNRRKEKLADEIDKVVHAIFGKDAGYSEWYLRKDRFGGGSQDSKPKPVFGGCDAHNFEDLNSWLGKAVDEKDSHQVVTWVKADPTFAGLQQALVEPRDRVSLEELKPDTKDSYKVIKKVCFDGSNDFPDQIELNPNLNAIIGSRSSGKSALLAHIAHAINPDYTVRQQALASPTAKPNDLGPAAGLSWGSVAETNCEVEWADGSTAGGSVIYIPQNWLYQISNNPKEVTQKIQPAIEHRYSQYVREHDRQLDAVQSANDRIEIAVGKWFAKAEEIRNVGERLRQAGDKSAVAKEEGEVVKQIEEVRSKNALSADDLENYQKIVDDIEGAKTRLDEIEIEAEQLDPYVLADGEDYEVAPFKVDVDIAVKPDPDALAESPGDNIRALVDETRVALTDQIEAVVLAARKALSAERSDRLKQIKSLEDDNKELIEKHKANSALDELVKRQKGYQATLKSIEKLEKERADAIEEQAAAIDDITASFAARSDAHAALEVAFNLEPRVLDQLEFGVAVGIDPDVVKALSAPFSKRERGTYVTPESLVDVDKACADPRAFLEALFERKQKLNTGFSEGDTAKNVLTVTPEVRFTAELDGDTIGGFARSTMTPGKQALFALTLILAEADDVWTLLIDQPEDDLDSRSIYGEIVTYLVEQKKRRQIILVTHNANLVVGADAEQVLVANRHGDDRKNRADLTFDYKTGSLEHSEPVRKAKFELDRMGVREHAVEILDGGVEAFQKRRDKYKL
ncbi:TrlF family AAA-like ATPase [Demequina sp.]|uniref:TrlF family AAA-like ATPase n=1 Tax=Demequina sp. TaxID=2050685 RepID=UPI0025BAD7ED|nr:AAA family ATPase [Demequina sp.]